MIDLRSDTVTRPTPGMLEAMGAAEVGDDVYGEDPTVTELEQRVAELFGHEAALFCVTGSLTNMLGVRLLVEPGQEVLCDASAHIVRAELGGHAAMNGITSRTWHSAGGVTEIDAIEEMIAPAAGPYMVSTAAVALENTHNLGGGTIQPLEHLQAVRELTRRAGVATHLDGARLGNAHVATGVGFAEYGELFDTISLCLSKGLGAPVGSVLVSSADNIARARVLRKRFGAGWRQAGILAAAGLYALDNQLERLADDHGAASALAEEVAGLAPSAVQADRVQSNIVVLSTGEASGVDVAVRAAEEGVAVSALGPHMVRAVTHLDVTTEECRTAGKVLGKLLAGQQ